MFIKGFKGKFDDSEKQEEFDGLKKALLGSHTVINKRIDSVRKQVDSKGKHGDLIELFLDQSKTNVELLIDIVCQMMIELYEYGMRHDDDEAFKKLAPNVNVAISVEPGSSLEQNRQRFNACSDEEIEQTLKKNGVEDKALLKGFMKLRRAYKEKLDRSCSVAERIAEITKKYSKEEIEEFNKKWGSFHATLSLQSFNADDIKSLQKVDKKLSKQVAIETFVEHLSQGKFKGDPELAAEADRLGIRGRPSTPAYDRAKLERELGIPESKSGLSEFGVPEEEAKKALEEAFRRPRSGT